MSNTMFCCLALRAHQYNTKTMGRNSKYVNVLKSIYTDVPKYPDLCHNDSICLGSGFV